MPTRALYRGTSSGLTPQENSAPFFVDSDDNLLKVQPNGAGDSTEVVVTALPATPGAVLQSSSITTGVTLNATRGQITTFGATLIANAEANFTVTNSAVVAGSVPTVAISTYTGAGQPMIGVTNMAVGSFQITITNVGAVALDALLVISFVVL